MGLSPGNRALTDWIHHTLSAGIALTDRDLDFIENTCGLEPGEDLGHALEDPESWGAESVAALVFSADESTQIGLVPLIHENRFTDEDATYVKSALGGHPVPATILAPEPAAPLNIAVGQYALDCFVDSLHITRRVPGQIAESVRAHVPEKLQPRTMQRIRMAGPGFGEGTLDTLTILFRHLAGDNDFFPMLALILDILATTETPDQVYEQLAFRKRRLYRGLQEVEKFNRAREQHNMETLMMRGVRVPAMDSEEARRQMNLIDRICQSMFGKTEVIIPEGMTLTEDRFARDPG